MQRSKMLPNCHKIRLAMTIVNLMVVGNLCRHFSGMHWVRARMKALLVRWPGANSSHCYMNLHALQSDKAPLLAYMG